MTRPAPSPNVSKEEVYRLAVAVIEGDVSDTEAQRFERLIAADPTARGWYVDLVCDVSSLRRLNRAEGSSSALPDKKALAPTSEPPAAAPVLGFLGSTAHSIWGYSSSGWPLAYLVATVVFGLGLLIGSHVYVSGPEQLARQSAPLPSPLSPLPSMVGRITGMVDCQWKNDECRMMNDELPARNDGIHPSSFILHPSSSVSLGDKYALASGLVEITYDTGAKVILQGPVTYEVETPRSGFLSLGKLTARVENAKPQAASPKSPNLQISKLFVVRTPTAIITDLGTEFGVEVSKEGHTTSHVFRGSVSLQLAAADGKMGTTSQVLHENESARVERSRDAIGGGGQITVARLPASAAGFVREIPRQTIKAFDLVDVVAGGDGFSGRRNQGIDPRNGRLVDVAGTAAKKPPWSGDGKYHRVSGRPFVDGVFIPDGGKGAVQVDSAGHVCDEFPATANATWEAIWAGGQLGDDPTRIDDVDYASPGHGLIYLNGDSAVTFDLEAVRQASPGCKVLRFRATAANTCSDINYYADIWVLIDGKKQFQRRQINASFGGFSVLVPICDKDRFLTLAATDGGDGIHFDLIAFGDPRLELLPLKQNMSK